MNTQKCIRYKDVWVAPGSLMFEALQAGQQERAAKIYAECEGAYVESQRCTAHGRHCWICSVTWGQRLAFIYRDCMQDPAIARRHMDSFRERHPDIAQFWHDEYQTVCDRLKDPK